MKLVAQLSVALVVYFAPVSLGSAADVSDTDFQEFLSLWGGGYDNVAQATAQEAEGVSAEDRNPATLVFIRKINLPAFGPHTYYGEWQDANDPSRILRQRIYGFEIDQVEQKLRLNLHIWPAASPEFVARTQGAHLDPSTLNDVTPADMFDLKGCDIYFTKTDDGYRGSMKKGECSFPAPDGSGSLIYSWTQMTVNESQFSYLDGWYNSDGTPYRRFTKNWYVYDKKN
ncbi:MAG: hypothetical protein GKS03_11730 [Alphaproteobacteria bacterium]|nr:hypothetical protein [Alphaproteobacteria bacterium]